MDNAAESKIARSPELTGAASESLDGRLSSTERKVRFGFVLALACLLIVGAISYLSVVRLSEKAAWVDHTYEVLNRLQSLVAAATDSETAERGYVITGDEKYLEPYRQSARLVEVEATQLRRLTADRPDQQQRINSVAALAAERLADLRSVIDLRRELGFEAAKNEILTGKGMRFHDQIRGLIGEMKGTETSLLAERERSAQVSSTLAKLVILGGGLLACGIVVMALWAIRRDFAGRTRAERALREANSQLEGRVQQRTLELARQASIIEFSDDAIVSKDLNGIITSWNPGAEKLFGYSAAEVLGKPMMLLIPPERSSEEPAILA
ncbi:MAG TPA: CHASE3 domain-containing protein, partial [Candidatus Sulfotelmatobacter sp.]|nr:CHASE3 domain-containing protein [Candidatus Sulfotelmatobacter sp.]